MAEKLKDEKKDEERDTEQDKRKDKGEDKDQDRREAKDRESHDKDQDRDRDKEEDKEKDEEGDDEESLYADEEEKDEEADKTKTRSGKPEKLSFDVPKEAERWFDSDLKDAFLEVGRETGLTREQLQAVVDLHAADKATQAEAVQSTLDEWRHEILTDEKIGKRGQRQALQGAKQVYGVTLVKALQEYLETGKPIPGPMLVRAFQRIGAENEEDRSGGGGGERERGPNPQESELARLRKRYAKSLPPPKDGAR